MVIKTLENVINIDDKHYVSRYGNSIMSVQSDGVTIINGGIALHIAYDGTSVDDVYVFSAEELAAALLVAFKSEGQSGEGGVESVSGNLVSGTPAKPVVSLSGGTPRHILTTDENGKPEFKLLSWQQWSDPNFGEPPFPFGIAATSLKDGKWELAFMQGALDPDTGNSIVIPNALPLYQPGMLGNGGGTLPVADARSDSDAVNLGQLRAASTIPAGTPRDILTWDSTGKAIAKPIGITQLTDIEGFPSFTNGVFTATSINSTAKTALLSFIEFSTTTPKAGTFPTYGTAGVLPIGNATADNHAAAFGQLPKVATVAPLANGTAAVGTSALYARQDHVHPLQASVATLTTGRTIGLTGGATGTSVAFNGSANVTITVTLATPTATVRGGVLQQPAIPDINGRPIDESDYNTLLAALRTAGLLAI